MAKAGIQLYSIRELMGKDFYRTLADTAKCGFDGVEFAGFYDEKAEDVRDALDRNGLVCCGSHTSISLLEEGTIDGTMRYNNAIGNNVIICPSLPKDIRDSEAGWLKTAENFNKIGKRLYENGFVFGYHNHSFEFEKFSGKYAYDILAENTDPRYVKLQVDTMWVEYAGISSVELIKKYSDRLVNIHVKQMKAKGSKECTEINKGIIDFKEIIKLSQGFGVEWFILEQENFDIPMLESITESCTYMKSIF